MDSLSRADEEQFVVLVVDDESFMRRLLTRVLSPTCRVLTAASKDEALQVIAQGEVDAVLTDVAMPGGSGLELAAALRARDSALPLAFLTGSADDDVRAFARTIRAPLFDKPFHAPALTAWVGSLVSAEPRRQVVHAS